MVLCAWLNRWRGSGAAPHNPVEWSSTVQRIVLSVVLATPAILASPYHGLVIAVLIFWPGLAMGWGQYFDLQHKPNTEPEVRWIDKLKQNDYVSLSLRGLHFTVPTAIVASLVNPLALVLAPFGALMGTCYLFAKQHTKGDYISTAELLYGAVLGAVFFDMGVLMYFGG